MNFNKYHVSKNLFDEIYPSISGTIQYKPIYVGDGTFTLSTTTPYDSSVANVFLLSGDVSSGASTSGNGAWLKHEVTTQSIDGYVTIAYRHYSGTTSPVDCQTMLNTGSTPLPYEPYSSEVWHDIPHYIHKTATDTLTLPAVLYPNAVTATVGLKGNMEQSSQPSPTTPIQPSECGDLETSGAKAGQYKIPISSANTTTPVYLGEVETTRKIKKLVLTGDEAFTQVSDYQQSSRFRLVINDALRGADTYTADTIISTHYKSETGLKIGTIVQSNGIDIDCTFCMQSSEYPDLTTFKAYLAAQFAAGTPVCVWYVLATETTGIVNEPIRKIGDYADTVSGITIPTITGKDTFDVLTTLKPSEVTVNYKGWHTGAVHEYDSNYTIATMQALTIAQLQTHTISELQGGGWS